MVTCEVSNCCARSVTKTLPSRFRFSTMARRRSSLSTGFDPPGGIAGKDVRPSETYGCAFFLYRLLSFVQQKKRGGLPRRLVREAR
jgi:hypothetical protein